MAINIPIRFRGLLIPGTVEHYGPPPPEPMVYRTTFPGVIGTSEIYGGHASRPIEISIVLHGNFASRATMRRFIEKMNSWGMGQNGLLEYSDFNGERFSHADCTFEGFFPASEDVFDAAGTIDGTGQRPQWWCRGVLRWTQLTVKTVT